MAYQTITTIMTNDVADRPALDAAIDLAGREGAHLDILCLGIDRTQPEFYYAGAGAIASQAYYVEAERDAVALEKSVSEHMNIQGVPFSTRAIAAQSVGLTQFLRQQIRFTDLVVLPKPYGEGRGAESEAIIESALFDAGVPVLVIPDKKSLPSNIKQVVIAWNEGSEALVAIRAALPLLIAADSVDITIIDPPQHGPDRSDPGGPLSQLLARHGVNAEVSVLAKTMPRVADVLLRHMQDRGADLLVMGAYGHSRFRESILGGATRHILESTEFPVFMAH